MQFNCKSLYIELLILSIGQKMKFREEVNRMQKVPVTVETERTPDGRIMIRAVKLLNGRRFWIKRVLFYSASPDEYEGIRATVLIGRSEKYIYKTDDGWYVLA